MKITLQFLNVCGGETGGIRHLLYTDSTDWRDRTAAARDDRGDENVRLANQALVEETA